MILLKETAGDTLQGAIDGSNTAFEVSFDLEPGSVNIYVNGRLKVRKLDDGFDVIPPRTMVTKEPLLPGDTLEVEYRSDTKTGGGALAGRPEPASLRAVAPNAIAPQEDLPGVRTDELEPSASSRESRPAMLAAGLRPTLVRPEEA